MYVWKLLCKNGFDIVGQILKVDVYLFYFFIFVLVVLIKLKFGFVLIYYDVYDLYKDLLDNFFVDGFLINVVLFVYFFYEKLVVNFFRYCLVVSWWMVFVLEKSYFCWFEFFRNFYDEEIRSVDCGLMIRE